MTLAGKTAAVTGASGAIGSAIARALNEVGAKVVAIDIAEPISPEADAKVTSLRLDLSDAGGITAASSELVETLGSVDILVNNAGVLSNNKIHDTSLEEWRRVSQINFEAAFLLIRAFLPGMRARKWGRIINMSSYAAKCGGLTAGTAYSVSKSALNHRQRDRASLRHVPNGVGAADGRPASQSVGRKFRSAGSARPRRWRMRFYSSRHRLPVSSPARVVYGKRTIQTVQYQIHDGRGHTLVTDEL